MKKAIYALPVVALMAGLAAPVLAKGGHGHHGGFMLEMLDADKDGSITREEFETKAKERFGAADTDGDGYVSESEMKAHKAVEREARRARHFARADADGDGKLSAEEFGGRGEKMFGKLDADGDGVVSKSEIETMKGKHSRGPCGKPGRP